MVLGKSWKPAGVDYNVNLQMIAHPTDPFYMSLLPKLDSNIYDFYFYLSEEINRNNIYNYIIYYLKIYLIIYFKNIKEIIIIFFS